MILIQNQRFEIGYDENDIEAKIISKLKLNNISDIKDYKIIKESLDARKHDDIHFNVTIGVKAENEEKIVKLVHNNKIMLTNTSKYVFPHILNTDVREFLDIADEFRPVIIGSGPAGYHAAVKLATSGFKPIVLERGKPVEERVRDVEEFWKDTGRLDKDSNVCYGEGGAGTFSDGKLNTGNKDKGGYFKEVLETFVKYGANPNILYKSKPHIGTDELRNILVNMRRDIERLGGEIRFGHKLTGINHECFIDTFGYESELPIYELLINGPEGEYKHKTHSVILAIGHSARDTYKMLLSTGFNMEPKSFAMGVRVEHPAELINKAMYGENYRELYGDKLPNADYKLTYHTKDEENSRGVFSFCMCPGGYVVNSSTEDGHLVINGMSYSDRAGRNSNSAIVVSINPEDFESDDILAGAAFQEKLEEAAYKEGKGKIPVQSYGSLAKSGNDERFNPDILGGYTEGDLTNVLPGFMIDAILEAMPYFGKKIKDYDNPKTILSAVESRTSSPVRIIRNKDMMSDIFQGIIPAGEGAGYAGGITSAAADGIRSAEAISEYLIEDLIESYKNFEISKYM